MRKRHYDRANAELVELSGYPLQYQELMRLWKPDALCDSNRQTGGPPVLNLTSIDVGEPGSGQMRLR